jgi:hypothetical protein
MSKKLIAVASAAALALAGLVGIAPANSAVGAFSVVQNGAITETTDRNGTTAAKAWQINVPSADVLRYTATVAATGSTWNSTVTTLVKYTVTTPAANDAIAVSSTGGVKLLSDTQFASTTKTTATGTQALTLSNVAGEVAFYAYTTSTTAGSVVVSSGGSSSTTWLTGVSDFAYKLQLSGPASAGLGSKFSIKGKIKDAFGNDLTTPLSTASGADFVLTGVVGAVAVAADFAYDSVTKDYTFVYTAPSTATGAAVEIKLQPEHTAVKVTAFGDPVNSQFFAVNAVDLATQVTALTAQVAALTADYNALAAKWNKRVASKTAPKKKVATK